MPDYLPRSEYDLVPWTRNFAQRIAADAEAYGIRPETAAELLVLQQAYEAQVAMALAPDTRTRPAIRRKDQARVEMLQLLRNVAAMCRTLSSVSQAQLTQIGLKKPSKARRRIPRPCTHPTLRIVSASGNRVTIQLTDSEATTRKGLPRGVIWSDVYYSVHDTLSSDPKRWTMAKGIGSRARRVVEIDAGFPPGARVWFIARWISPTGKPGPWGPARTTRVLGAEVNIPQRRLNAA